MRVLSIEVGQELTHVVEMEKSGKNAKIYQYFSFPTPEGVVDENGVNRNEEFKRELSKNLINARIKTRKAIFVLNSGKIANREIEIPLVKDNKVLPLLKANSAEYFPVDLAKYQLVFRSIANPELEKQKKRKVFVLAVPHELVYSYQELARFCNLDLVNLDYLGNSLFQSMIRSNKDKVICNVNIDETTTMITLISNGEVEIQRTFYYGSGELTRLVEKYSEVFAYKKYSSPREVLAREQILALQLGRRYATDDEQLDALRNDATDAMRPLIGNISRVIDYYLSRTENVEIKECILTGSASIVRDIDVLIGNSINIPTRILTPERSKFSGDTYRMPVAEYMACCGAALAPLKFEMRAMLSEDGTGGTKRQGMLLAKLVFALCLIGSAGMAGLSVMNYTTTLATKGQLEKQRNNLQSVQDIYNQYLSMLDRYNDVVAMNSNTDTVSDNLAKAIDEMEKKLPSSVQVSSLTSDKSAVSMQITVDTKLEAAKIVQELKNFDIFYDVEVGSIRDQEDESGKSNVSFTVTCYYVGGELYEEEENQVDIDVETIQKGEQNTTIVEVGEEAKENEQ